jgi:hypothetical protein
MMQVCSEEHIMQGFGSSCYEGQTRTCMHGVPHFGAREQQLEIVLEEHRFAKDQYKQAVA